MNRFLTALLVSCAWGVHADPEWQFYFPDQAADIGGNYIDPNQALVIKRVAGQVQLETLDLADITGLNIADHVAVTGFSARRNATVTTAFNYVFTLSAPIDGYPSGAVIECAFNGCSMLELFTNTGQITSLEYFNRMNELWVSFDRGIEVSGQYISPANVYRTSDFSVAFDGVAAGLVDNSIISAFDLSEATASFSATTTNDLPLGVVGASEVYSTLAVLSSASAELAAEVSGVNAYFSADSGWIEFAESQIQVFENVGSFTVEILRVGGVEYNTSAILTDIEGTALEGVDYDNVFAQYIWLDDGATANNATINITDNDLVDGNKSFKLLLSEASGSFGFSLVNPVMKEVVITIVDDDGDLIFADDFE